jgi:peptidoglycan/LPS O-acetylase OafA/YrhL
VSRRLDIQGLRALAVLAVVAFHAGLPLPGGFVGVDVFFVISGFVITRMLRREWDATGRIRFGAFYLRRFKRLTPALALVVVVTAVAAELVLSPLGAQQTVAETGLGAMFLAANWVIASNTGGYFDAPAAQNPLLHTWSLSVEEQFYLVFPALLALGFTIAARSSRRRHTATAAVALVGATSFLVALVGVNPLVHSWLFGFYSPLTRAWEFAAGALIALAGTKAVPRTRFAAWGSALAGLGLVAASFALVDARTPFPGAWTLLPVGGTVLLLVAGGAPNPVSRVLATRPLVRLGDWSYSIYLWHWPFIVFATALWPDAPHARAIAAAASLAPSLASYTWIEQPVRSLGRVARPRLGLLVAVVLLAPMIVATAVGSAATNVWEPRYTSGKMPVANGGDLGQAPFYRYLRRASYPCVPRDLRAQALTYDGVLRCRQSKRAVGVDVAIIGDSHAEHLFVGFADALRRDNVAYYLVDDAPITSDANFARIVDDVVAQRSIRTVVVNAFWSVRGVHGGQLTTTLRRLSSAGKHVFVTDDVPFFSFDPFDCKYRKALFLPADCSADIREFHREYAQYYPQLLATVRRVPRVELLETARDFCSATSCAMASHGRLLYRDFNHLNLNGSRFLAGRILRDYPAFDAAVSVR